LDQIAGRRRELEAELSAHFQETVSLTPAKVKGGYDEIFWANRNGERFGVVRVNSPFKRQNDPIGPRDPAVPLAFQERLTREWEAYERLAPAGLAPRPLWRTHDAIACSWINWDRASILLTRRRENFWPLFGCALAGIRQMHQCGVVHLDLNWGNLLAPATGPGLAIIDFEFGPVHWVTREQQLAYDYLRLIDDSAKPRRGGRLLLADLTRMEQLLAEIVPAEARSARMGFVFEKLHRLKTGRRLRQRLARVFPNLEA
jgi:hypothetical protein